MAGSGFAAGDKRVLIIQRREMEESGLKHGSLCEGKISIFTGRNYPYRLGY